MPASEALGQRSAFPPKGWHADRGLRSTRREAESAPLVASALVVSVQVGAASSAGRAAGASEGGLEGRSGRRQAASLRRLRRGASAFQTLPPLNLPRHAPTPESLFSTASGDSARRPPSLTDVTHATGRRTATEPWCHLARVRTRALAPTQHANGSCRLTPPRRATRPACDEPPDPEGTAGPALALARAAPWSRPGGASSALGAPARWAPRAASSATRASSSPGGPPGTSASSTRPMDASSSASRLAEGVRLQCRCRPSPSSGAVRRATAVDSPAPARQRAGRCEASVAALSPPIGTRAPADSATPRRSRLRTDASVRCRPGRPGLASAAPAPVPAPSSLTSSGLVSTTARRRLRSSFAWLAG